MTGPALEQQAAQAARRTLVTTVEQLTGVSVDHYAEVNLAGFADITQAVGGVPVCLNAPVRDSYSGADFPAGPQTLQGPAALAFVRQRHGLPRGDLDRVVRQQAFLASLAHEVLSTGTLADPAQVSGLIAAVSRYVVVDSGWDLLAFAAQARGLTAGAISFRTIPTGRPNLPTPDDGVAVQIDPRAVRDFVGTLSEGTPVGAPRASAEESAPPESGDDGGRAQSAAATRGCCTGACGPADHRRRRPVRQLSGSHTGNRVGTQVVTCVRARHPWCERHGSCVRAPRPSWTKCRVGLVCESSATSDCEGSGADGDQLGREPDLPRDRGAPPRDRRARSTTSSPGSRACGRWAPGTRSAPSPTVREAISSRWTRCRRRSPSTPPR